MRDENGRDFIEMHRRKFIDAMDLIQTNRVVTMSTLIRNVRYEPKTMRAVILVCFSRGWIKMEIGEHTHLSITAAGGKMLYMLIEEERFSA